MASSADDRNQPAHAESTSRVQVTSSFWSNSNVLMSRVVAFTIFGASYGACTGYYIGTTSLAVPLYANAAAAAMLSTTFFSSQLVLHLASKAVTNRPQGLPDGWNDSDAEKFVDISTHGAAGAITGGAYFSVTRGWRKAGARGILLGLISGVAYKIVGDWIYESSRQAWITSRRSTISSSKERRLFVRRPMFPPREDRVIFGRPRRPQGEDAPIVPDDGGNRASGLSNDDNDKKL